MSTQSIIESKLHALQPRFLEVINESGRHNVPPGSESHFKVTIVSERFAGQAPLARHRMINEVLAAELAGSVHALALHPMTEAEWQHRRAPESPPCLGGSAADKG